MTGDPSDHPDRDPACVICRGPAGDAELERFQVWEDQEWRLTISLSAEVAGFAYLEPKRHIRHTTELDGPEARSFGEVLARTTTALREETGAELVYAYIFGDGAPHLHVHLAPHRANDALSSQIIRGELREERLPSGFTRVVSASFPPLPEGELRKIGLGVGRRLAAPA